jgi:hypothetical protein
MSIHFRTESTSHAPSVADAGTVADHAGQVGCYLTDGVNLYRCLGAIAGGTGQLVGLENCRSLDLILLPIGELRARRLRAVIPAGGEQGTG